MVESFVSGYKLFLLPTGRHRKQFWRNFNQKLRKAQYNVLDLESVKKVIVVDNAIADVNYRLKVISKSSQNEC